MTLAAAALLGCGPEDGKKALDDGASGGCVDGVCVLTGALVEDMTLTADKVWLLRGGVFVGDDQSLVTLTIEPGTTVYGETSTAGMLVITRGARIMANGTAESPIVFTSSKAMGSRARGDWGGLIINGRAPVNGCPASQSGPCESFGEGGTGYYGGNIPDDNSGVLRYVRIEFAGRLVSPDNELNGIAFQGVGRGTTVDYLQVHMAKDDCVEFFGGTVDVRHILCTGIADDNLDWTDGWVGRLQFLVAQQYDDAGDNGIEADNNAEDNTSSPRSHPTISNFTLIGAPGSDQSDLGILLREGTAANLFNGVVMGWGDACLDVDHSETFSNALDSAGALTGELTISDTLFFCDTAFQLDSGEPVTVDTFAMTLNQGNATADPMLQAPYNMVTPDFRPLAASPAMSGTHMPADPFFTVVTFRGGEDPAAPWTRGWTTSQRN